MSAQDSLFAAPKSAQPLAEQLRPTSLHDVVGQPSVSDPNGALARMVATGNYHSVILWGPAGCGKTTIARLLAQHSDIEFVTLSAVQSGVADLKKQFEAAANRLLHGKRTLLFVDEIHRFNRAQQDAFLPVMEDGTIILIGATTENPSFELNGALLSRAQVVVLSRLDSTAIDRLFERAETHYAQALPLSADAREALAAMADGDGRYALNLVERIMSSPPPAGGMLSLAQLEQWLQTRAPTYDKGQESHYNLISALHKSLRGSDVDAALYWLARMLAGGEDPMYLLRRLVRFAVEDIGMADPNALLQANGAREAYAFLGSPEGDLAIVQAVVYLATAPKSNAQYVAAKAAQKSAKTTGSLMPPAHILNAPTKLMKTLGYGEGYAYDHDAEDGFSGQHYFPDKMPREQYYHPKEVGFEREISKRLTYWDKLRKAKT